MNVRKLSRIVFSCSLDQQRFTISMVSFRHSSHLGLVFSDCTVGNEVMAEGSTWREGCVDCRCESGKVVCASEPTCDCHQVQAGGSGLRGSAASATLDPSCCPHCFRSGGIATTCLDQSGNRHLSGETWSTNCKQCQCRVSRSKSLQRHNQPQT